MSDQLSGLTGKIGYQFQDMSLLQLALTHRSFSKRNNERLEFLGDAILEFVITETLYHKFLSQSEGVLTRLRASLVRKETLAELARELELGDLLKLGGGEKKTGGWRRDSILANAMEAIIGALYLDAGLEKCRQFILDLYNHRITELSADDFGKDPKTELQEYLQARKLPLPNYNIVAEEGEAHVRRFTVSCQIEGMDKTLIAQGKSRRIAEQTVARKALDELLSHKQA